MLKLFIFEFFENFFGKSLRKLEVVLAGATFGSGLRLSFFLKSLVYFRHQAIVWAVVVVQVVGHETSSEMPRIDHVYVIKSELEITFFGKKKIIVSEII